MATLLLSVAVTLIGWSIWWPHPDMRQSWADVAATVYGFTGLGSLLAWRRTFPIGARRRHRRYMLGIGAVATTLGIFAIVFSTLKYR